MWRRSLLPVILVILFVGSFPFVAHAQKVFTSTARGSATPISCSGCYQDRYWPESSNHPYGGQVYTVVSSPNTTSGNDHWYRAFVEAQGNGQGGLLSPPIVYVDIENGANAPCVVQHGAGTYYNLVGINSAGTEYEKCQPVPSGDINQQVRLKIGDYVSNGGGNLINVDVAASNHHYNMYLPKSDGFSLTFTTKDYEEYIDDPTINSHLVWGVAWTGSCWIDSHGNCNYDTADGLQTSGGTTPPPPQMYWNVPPSQSSTGGVLYSCVYNTKASVPPCTPGS